MFNKFVLPDIRSMVGYRVCCVLFVREVHGTDISAAVQLIVVKFCVMIELCPG